ncbi:MAG: CDP-2,3-bis-(O-geranylgeranyl)-sn-glycerol synthase [Thermoprotei archaeon]|nr:MAG: CDP-2,3-bis-(O-geranylgeranyl)-sn-glycerol synthase [Thermoprotei archaeon]RLE90150.1 MAG: CDP-2,3-bis-(O-geranylgeranyl)-sn-glycerol synthase [Thermoprotei archaeon]
MRVIDLVLETLIFIFPSYVANATPLIATKLLNKQTPIDRGKLFIDNRRILGNGKTIEGSLTGIAMGTLCSIILQYLQLHSFRGGVIMSIGAILGDLLGSFIKRRLNIPRGKPLPILDQLSFLLTAEAMYWLLIGSLPMYILLISVVITLILHPLSNVIAYILGLKQVPW